MKEEALKCFTGTIESLGSEAVIKVPFGVGQEDATYTISPRTIFMGAAEDGVAFASMRKGMTANIWVGEGSEAKYASLNYR